MSHHVPEFDLDDFCPVAASTQSRQHKNMPDDDIMELVWHHGQPRVQNQSQRLLRPPSPPSRPPQPASTTGHLFMQEDEMTSWLHYPLDDVSSFDQNITDLLYQPPAGPSTTTLPPPSPSIRALPPPELKPQPLLPPPPPQPQRQTRPQLRPLPAQPSAAGVNFPQFARMKAKVVPESGQSASSTTTTTNNNNNNVVVAVQRESTVVDSSDTLKSRSLQPVGARRGSVSLDAGCSESDGSATPTADLVTHAPSSHDRKRKGVESADAFTNDNHSEDLDVDQSYETKKPCRGTSAKRSRATEVHNLSERKRRDKINEKMKALQELIPRCTKTDKASMLDEAIEYMKSLQMQLQMMSMGYYGMVPMMFPGVQQYMPMGMGMDMGMNRPMVPFPMQTSRAPSPMGPRFQFPAYQTPPIPSFHPPRAQTSQMESVGNLNCPSDANVYQQYLSAQQMLSQPISENPPPNSTPSTSKASTSKEAEDHENHPSSTDMHYNRNK